MRKGFEALKYVIQYLRVIFWHLVKRAGLTSPIETLQDQQKDAIAPFDEFPPCEMCGTNSVREVLVTRDNCRIVECDNCGLWFTSPRIKEETWVEYLKRDTKRSREFTENRLKYGVALSSNIKYSPPDWRRRRMRIDNHAIDAVQECLGAEVKRLHDVGCGIGLLQQAAQARGIETTGNDLNGYACKVMRERLGLKVYNDILPNLPLEEGSLDAVVMQDYIEHTYHPLEDLKASYRFLRLGGVILIETFHIDCRKFDRLKENWDMLRWNHVFHFSTKSLKDMIMRAGFDIKVVSTRYDRVSIKVIASKPASDFNEL